MDSRHSPRRWLVHLAWLIAFSIPPNIVLLQLYARAGHTVELREKIASYLRSPAGWNLLFVGDSRTYTDFDPDRLDPLLGTRSLNLAYWANWFPTQYASFADLVPRIPRGTVVVWSIGEQNFRAVAGKVNSAYPIRPWDVPRYVGWGYALTTLQDNVASGLLDALPIHAVREPLRNFLGSHLPAMGAGAAGKAGKAGNAGNAGQAAGEATAAAGAGAVPAEFGHAADYERLRAFYQADPAVARVRPWIDGDRVTSLEVVSRRGHYMRVELDSLYFREKQDEMASRAVPLTSDFTASAEYWRTFVAILELFRRYDVRLIVNQVEEAPYQYAVGDSRAHTNAFMRRVRAEVERHGFPYVCVDWERFKNSDYFDYNHLNRRGIERFTPMFAAAIRPRLP